MGYLFLPVLIHIYSGLIECFKFISYLPFGKDSKISQLYRKERFSLPSIEKDIKGHRVIWIHAASIGEAKVIFNFLKILGKKKTGDLYILTAVTDSGVNYLQKHKTESVCAVGFMPIDTVSMMNRMLYYFNVSRVWLVETELWPCMLWTCFKHHIPVGIVNARMEEKSFSMYRLFKAVVKPLFNQINTVFAQDDVYASRFKAMGVPGKNIITIGNIKSRVIISPLSSQQKKNVRESMNIAADKKIITVGCVHPIEASVINNTVNILISQGYIWKWIVVPRHINKADVIIKELREGAVRVAGTDLSGEWNICLIEAFGVLEDMYMIADAAVLGGTFINVGGHNVWEAVQYAIPVFLGPDYHTQRESCEKIISSSVGYCVSSAEELAKMLVNVLITDPSGFSSSMSLFMDKTNKKISSVETLITRRLKN